jgi:hypothetical protein
MSNAKCSKPGQGHYDCAAKAKLQGGGNAGNGSAGRAVAGIAATTTTGGGWTTVLKPLLFSPNKISVLGACPPLARDQPLAEKLSDDQPIEQKYFAQPDGRQIFGGSAAIGDGGVET